MPRALTVIALLTALVLLAASSTINYLFASSLGRTPLEGVVLGVVAVGVDILKAVLAVAIGVAARDKRWGFVGIGSIAFFLFSALSLSAAFGFSATNRSAVFGERERLNNRLGKIEANAVALRDRLKSLPTYRPLAVVDEALAVARSDWRWTTSRQCTAVPPSLRGFCDEHGKLRNERAAALEAHRIGELLAQTEAEADTLRGSGSGSPIDPQAKALAQSIGFDERQVQRGLMGLLAIVIEVASGFGAYLALGTGIGKKPNAKQKALQPALTDKEATEAPIEPKPAKPLLVEAQTETYESPEVISKFNKQHAGLVIGTQSSTRTTRRNGVQLGTGALSVGSIDKGTNTNSGGGSTHDKTPEQ